MTALLKDLKARGMLDDTLVVWGGEFGRTPFRENRGGKYGKWVGRDHSPGAFTMWMAGGGAKKVSLMVKLMKSVTMSLKILLAFTTYKQLCCI